jgi:hypothetical protein
MHQGGAEPPASGRKFGCISVAAPFVGFAVVIAFALLNQPRDTEGWAAVAAAVIVAPAVILGGTIAAVISFRRKERPLILPVLGLLLNLGPILWLIVAWIWTALEGQP